MVLGCGTEPEGVVLGTGCSAHPRPRPGRRRARQGARLQQDPREGGGEREDQS